MTLIGEILKNKKLAPKQRFLEAIRAATESIKAAPIKAVKSGLERDAAAVEAYRQATGISNPRLAIAKKVMQGIYEGGGRDLTVNIGGTAGSILGAKTLGFPGKLAGDWLGAAVTRKSLDDIENIAYATKVSKSQKFQKLSPFGKARLLNRRLSRRLNRTLPSVKEEYQKDTIGWAIGNAAAETFDATGTHIVPLQGGLVAATTVPSVLKGIKSGIQVAKQQGVLPGVKEGINRTGMEIKTDLADKLAKASQATKGVVKGINDRLNQLPTLPPDVDFSKTPKFYYMANFNNL